MTSKRSLMDELTWRGLAYQYTEGLVKSLVGEADARGGASLTAYCGFDPTAPSLHVGNLVPVMGLVHLQRYGHRPVALVGGGTGMIGDPSGKSSERQLNSVETVEENGRAIGDQLSRFLDFTGPRAALMRDNAEWLRNLGAIEFMREVGKHFTINYMTAKESVKARLESGISYTEFSYMLLQAYDYLELHLREGATLQIGGSDQWGNITAGIELIRRTRGAEVHALTLPLVTTATGTKFGKTEAGSVWLDASLTSPYRFYQFWINVDDRDVGRYLRYFTLMERDEIEALEAATTKRPDQREAQRGLADEVTSRVHGPQAARVAREVSGILFGTADLSALSPAGLEALSREVPFVEIPRPAGGSLDTVEVFVTGSLSASKAAARRLLEQGGLYVNGRRLAGADRSIATDNLLPGGYLLLRKGAREYCLMRIREL
ncbi:MAG: tyrosine--tRNA ligase [Gemmatimonadaceae bacterium]